MSISPDPVHDPASAASPAPAVSSGAALRAKPSMASYVFYGLILCAGMAVAWLCFEFLLKSEPVRAAKKITAPSRPSARLTPAPVSAVSLPPPGASGRGVVQEKRADNPVEMPALVLSGVFTSQAGDFAILNNQVVQVGSSIEGARLLAVTSSGVSLEFGGRTFELSTRKR